MSAVLSDQQAALREEVKKLLADGTVKGFIGYARGRDSYHPAPTIVTRPDQVDGLILDQFCIFGLPKYLLDYIFQDGKMGIVVKGCDSLALGRLLADHRVDRAKVHVIGLPCAGILNNEKVATLGLGKIQKVTDKGTAFLAEGDKKTAELPKAEYLWQKCQWCENHNPVACDTLLGAEVENVAAKPRDYSDVKELEKMSAEEKSAYWARQFSRCIRCYACRNVCPACNCRECVFDIAEPRWLGNTVKLSDQQMFHFTRAFHVAGRCVDCGECERVCPMEIPLMRLQRKLQKDIIELFGNPKPYAPSEVESLGQFRASEDPEEFM
ncbi:MAG TPA: 4Fe-4S dicluster domain-containing protein [Bacillota bacterium]|jgi:ferredoxin